MPVLTEVEMDKTADLEAAPREVPPACTVRVHRESLCTGLLYLVAIASMGLCLRHFSDRDFSCILTIGAGCQAFGYALLLHKVQLHRSVAGLSARSLELSALFYVCRLASTTTRNGYIPVDRSGDWLYQCFDVCALLFVLQLLHCVHSQHRTTYQRQLDLGPDFLRILPALVILAFFVHADLNHDVAYDVVWQISLHIDTAALIPQLLLLYRLPGVDALNAHALAALVLGKFCSFLFWFWGFPELARADASNLAGYVIVGCHCFMLLASAEFMIKYLRVAFTAGHEVLQVLDEK